MQKRKIVSAIGLYMLFLFIGHHGPLSNNKQDDHHPHTHKKHVIKLFKKEDDLDGLFKARKYSPLTT